MVYKRINEQYLTDIADAIRSKNGLTTTYKPREMAAAVNQMKTVSSDNATFLEFMNGTITNIYNTEVTKIGSGPFRFSGIKSITLPYVTSVNDAAFSFSSTSIETLILPRCKNMYAEAFEGSTALKTVDLQSLETVGEYAFDGCTNMVSSSTLSNLTSVGNCAFRNCTSLGEVDLSKVATIGTYAFQNCTNLTMDDNKVWPSVTTIGSYAFQNCTNLTGRIEARRGVLTTIGTSAFENTNIKSLHFTFAGSDSSSTCVLGQRAFAACPKLTYAVFDGVETVRAEAFKDCTKLYTVDLGSDIKKIQTNAFAGCSNLGSVWVGSLLVSNMSQEELRSTRILSSAANMYVPAEKLTNYQTKYSGIVASRPDFFQGY